MANVFTIVPGRVSVIAKSVGHAKFTFTTTTSYTAGMSIDFFVPFRDAGINPYDIQEISGYTELGYLAVFAKGTLSSTTSPWLMSLWNGISAHAASIPSGNIHINVIFYPGAK